MASEADKLAGREDFLPAFFVAIYGYEVMDFCVFFAKSMAKCTKDRSILHVLNKCSFLAKKD